MRDDFWLQGVLKSYLDGPFSDMPRENSITIGFGRRTRRRFGSINMSRDKKASHIRINGIFRNEAIPDKIIQATIAHELCHYAHGFCSPLKQKYRHPHSGGVIRREMKKRGLEYLYIYEKTWSRKNWPNVLNFEFPLRARPIRRRPTKRKRTLLAQVLYLLKP